MVYKKIVIQFTGSAKGLPTADQLFGQMVWAWSDMLGEERATEIVRIFHDDPWFLLSAAMPAGYVPIPRYRHHGDSTVEKRAHAKKNKKCAWIPIKQFLLLQDDPDVFSTLDFSDDQPRFSSFAIPHVSINRLSGCADDGQLYQEQVVCIEKPITVFLSIQEKHEKDVESLLDVALSSFGQCGLGGDRAIGRGACHLKLEELSEGERGMFAKKSQSFMTLSRCSGLDLSAYSYAVTAYAGIIGRGCTEGGMQFNKQPVLYFEPGSLFLGGKGCLLDDIHPDKRICSYAYAFPVPISIGGGHEQDV